jgi:hypothetical protein
MSAFQLSTADRRSNSLRLFVALIATIAVALAAAVMASSANAAFGISNYAMTPSTTQAGAHPNMTWSFNRTGTESEDLRDMRIDLPPGLLANPESVTPKCTEAAFSTDTCAPNTQVGSLAYKFTYSGRTTINVPGNFYMLEPGASDVATVGFVLRPPKVCILIFCAVTQKITQKTSFKLKSFDAPHLTIENQDAQRAVTTSIPLVFVTPSFSVDVTLKSVSITAQARAAKTKDGKYFMVNPTSCAPASSTATITSYDNVVASASSAFTPTGCDTVPFDPTFDFQPTDKGGGKTSTVAFTMNVPSADAQTQNSAPKSLDITFPAGSAPDFTKLAEWAAKPRCAQADLEANTCPSGSAVGLAQAQSEFLPPALNGGVYLTGEVGLKIDLAIRLVGPRSSALIIRLTLGLRVNSAGASEVYATFNDGPQLPYSKFILALLPLYVNPQQCGPAVTTVKATGWSGKEVTRTTSYDVGDCQPPQTAITSGPTGPTVTNPPTFTFTSSIPNSKFFCKVDALPEVSCDSGSYTLPTLSNGPHTFSVAAQNGPARDLTPAIATFSIVPPTGSFSAAFTLSTTQAAAHPNLTTTITAGGTPAMRSIQVRLPDGLQASSAAVPLCTMAAANTGACPASSQVGTVSVTASTAGGPVTGNGIAYLTAPPTAADAGGISIEVPLAGGTLIVNGGQSTVNNTNAQQLTVRDIPASVNGTAISITNLTLALSGANRFLTNASNCATASSFVASATAADGSISSPSSTPYQATNCTAVPFAPQVTMTYPSPLVAGSPTGVVVDVDLPLDHGTLRSLTVLQPTALGPNFPAYGAASDQCPASAAPAANSLFNPAGCPASALIGEMTIDTPLLASPLVGDVYLINKSPLPWFGVTFSQPGVELRLTGVNTVGQVDPLCDPLETDCPQRISTRFGNLPDTPLTHTRFDLTKPDRTTSQGLTSSKVLTVATPSDPSCEPSVLGEWNATSWTGATRSGTFPAFAVSGCL